MIDTVSQDFILFPPSPLTRGLRCKWRSGISIALIAISIIGCAPGPLRAQDTEVPPSQVENSPTLPAITATATDQPIAIPVPSSTVPPSDESASGLDLQLITSANIDQLVPIHNLDGHQAPVLSVTYSLNGSLIASGSEDKTIRLWDANDGSLVYELTGHTDFVNDLSFSPDGVILASGSSDGTVRFWNIEDGRLIRTIDSILLERVLNVEFSPAGNLIAVGGHRCFIELRHVSSGIFFRTISQPECVERHNGPVAYWGIDFTADGQEIVTGEGRACCGGSVQRRDVERYTPPTLLEGYQLRVRDLDISPDDSTLTIALLGSPVFWLMDAADGNLLQTFEGHTFRVNSVVFSPDGDLIASGSRDGLIGLWTSDGTLLTHLEGHADAVNSVAFSPNGDSLASGADDGMVIVWGVP